MGAYTRVIYHGKTFDKFSVQSIQRAEKRLGYELTVIQGSYNGGVAASAGTHDGGGAMDLSPYDWERKCRILRQEGWAAWHRPAIAGLWGEHIHCIQYDNKKLSSGAKSQVTQYYQHRDGLAGWGWDSQWRPDPIPHFHYHKPKPKPKINLTHLLNAYYRPGGRTYNPWGRKACRQWHKALKREGLSGKRYKFKQGWFGNYLKAATRRANDKYDITKYDGPEHDRPTWELAKKLGFRPYKTGDVKRPKRIHKASKTTQGSSK